MEWWRSASEIVNMWIVVFNTVVGSLLALTYGHGFSTISWQERVVQLAIFIIFVVIGTIWGFLIKNLEKINRRVNLWIHEDKRSRKIWRELAEKLEDIVEELGKLRQPLEGEIALDGAKEVLKYKGLTYEKFKEIVRSLKTCSKFIGIATYGPGEWMDPFWFTYLIVQASLLKRSDVEAKRFFIYSKEIAESFTWKERLEAIITAVGESMPTYLVFKEVVENLLDNEFKEFLKKLYIKYNEERPWNKQSFTCLMDFIYIKISDTLKICKWRNPGKEGEPIDLDSVDTENFEKYIDNICRKLEDKAFLKRSPQSGG
jgi:hypothetical protein